MKTLIFSVVFFVSSPIWAQAPFIRSTGQAAASAKPDQAQLDFSVVTQAVTAQEASTQNASTVSAVLAKLQSVLGANADIRTLSYSLNPNYSNPSGAGNPTLIGYTATNTVEVTTGDLSIIGQVIDTGIAAGANRISSLQFSMKDPDPLRQQALRLATAQARAHAEAMAAGVGQHTGAVMSIQEGTSNSVVPLATAAVQLASTPIVTGTVQVQATVTLQVALTQ